jgi:hypothetical protein
MDNELSGMELEGSGHGLIWFSISYPGVCLEGQKKISKYLGEDKHCHLSFETNN